MKQLTNFIGTLCTAILVITTAASCGGARIDDLSQIDNYHQSSMKGVDSSKLTDAKGGSKVDLYIDYSDCMITAKNSPYYTDVQPAILACNPNYYSIKGKEIKFETNDKMKVHHLLNTITNVDYSNIKGAVDSIIANKNEAILITDGEFYQRGIGANLNNPYLADEFKEWLTMGYDIYIYSEPYTYQGFTKNRYYMLFTDHKLEENIQQIFSRNAPKQDDVKMVHLYSGTPTVKFEKEGAKFNDQLLITEDGKVNSALSYEYQMMDASWEDVYDYILNATDDDGNAIKGGDAFLKGIFIDETEGDAYKPSQLELKCYEISNDYLEFDPLTSEVKLPTPMKEMFVLDEEAWKDGEIVVKMHPNFDGSALTGTEGNFLRLDICVKQSKENFTNNPEIGGNFQFDSPYGFNTSVYESMKQTLLDPAISPENNGNPIIYTIYLSSFTK